MIAKSMQIASHYFLQLKHRPVTHLMRELKSKNQVKIKIGTFSVFSDSHVPIDTPKLSIKGI